MLIEVLSHAAALDFGWIISLPLKNPVMAFMLFAVFYMFLDGKKVIRGSIVIFIVLFAFLDFETVLGIPFFTGKFLVVYYVTKIAVLALAEGSKRFKGKLLFISEMQFYAAFVISVLFVR